MELDILKQNTTWNDASASINNNFAKVKTAIEQGGGGGGTGGGGSISGAYVEGETLNFTVAWPRIENNTLIL